MVESGESVKTLLCKHYLHLLYLARSFDLEALSDFKTPRCHIILWKHYLHLLYLARSFDLEASSDFKIPPNIPL